MGTYNYIPSTVWDNQIEFIDAWLGHFKADVMPYIVFKNTKN